MLTGEQPFLCGMRASSQAIHRLTLEQHGIVLKGLYNKTIEPQNEHQEQFVAVVTGSQEPTNPIERAWIKYLKLTTCKTKFHTLFGRSKISSPVPTNQEYFSESDNL